MKILLFLFLPILCYSQEDSITISVSKLIDIANDKTELIRKDSINTSLIGFQDKQISSYINLVEQDSVQISLLKLQNKSQSNIIDILNQNKKVKWYQSNWFWYILGGATMYFSSKLP